MLNRENLKGIFAAVPIPMREDGSFIESDFRADIARLCASGVHGVYIAGSTGEWYAMDDDEFRWLVEVFLDESGKFETLTQIGCGGVCTEMVLRRVRIATRNVQETDGLQIMLPPWQPLTDAEIEDFFIAVAAEAEGVPLVHYNTMNSKRLLGVKQYERLVNVVPTLIGTKFVSSDIEQIVGVLRAGLPINHFVGREWCAVPAIIWGSKGIYSDLSLCWPHICTRMFELCEQGEWDRAIDLQEKFIGFHVEGELALFDRGYSNAAWDKGKAEAAGFLRCKRHIRSPHRSMSEEDVQYLRKVGMKYFGDAIESSNLNAEHNASFATADSPSTMD